MNREQAQELAFAIISCEFEELLAEHGIRLPSEYREGKAEEACIYGEQYYLLEERITSILMKAGRRHGQRQQEYDIARQILDEFEELMDYHRVKVPSADPQRATSHAALCMPEWDRLRSAIVRRLRDALTAEVSRDTAA